MKYISFLPVWALVICPLFFSLAANAQASGNAAQNKTKTPAENGWSAESIKMAAKFCEAGAKEKMGESVIALLPVKIDEYCSCVMTKIAQDYAITEVMQKGVDFYTSPQALTYYYACYTDLQGLTQQQQMELKAKYGPEENGWNFIAMQNMVQTCITASNADTSVNALKNIVNIDEYCLCTLHKIKQKYTPEQADQVMTTDPNLQQIILGCVTDLMHKNDTPKQISGIDPKNNTQTLPDEKANIHERIIEIPINKEPWPEGSREMFVKSCIEGAEGEPGSEFLNAPGFCQCVVEKFEIMFSVTDMALQGDKITEHPAVQAVMEECASKNMKGK
ncbi:MAG: hypothetical protein IPI59_12740 [Sphingobacteriales bacterium]|jgi:hypothetical protein|nr:hypothetical protein [Sphingobacteriales bacterium]MBP9140676.1 hypothetical protein [Chitinophagales bacterium]MDA0198902.1 hypothetical protein [Bacteroidota bacterium]MBK6889108.1 hypothetical protein [Sphingobacteriales bacterium]MBK7528390.1 hypothetical protein [Sphingobacteriales bacterium]